MELCGDVIRRRYVIFIMAEWISRCVIIQFADKGVEFLNGHHRYSFIKQNFLFDEGDDKGNRILIGDTLIKRGSFLMLFNSLF